MGPGVGGWGAKDLLGGEHMVFRENGGGIGRFQQSIGRVLFKNDRRLIGQWREIVRMLQRPLGGIT